MLAAWPRLSSDDRGSGRAANKGTHRALRKAVQRVSTNSGRCCVGRRRRASMPTLPPAWPTCWRRSPIRNVWPRSVTGWCAATPPLRSSPASIPLHQPDTRGPSCLRAPPARDVAAELVDAEQVQVGAEKVPLRGDEVAFVRARLPGRGGAGAQGQGSVGAPSCVDDEGTCRAWAGMHVVPGMSCRVSDDDGSRWRRITAPPMASADPVPSVATRPRSRITGGGHATRLTNGRGGAILREPGAPKRMPVP